MKKTGLLSKTITIFCTILIALSTLYAFADSDDPLVSLSYLEKIFKPAFKTELKNELKSELSTSTSKNENDVTSKDEKFVVAVVPEGKLFIGDEGCEVILRSGNAVSVVSQNGGLCDVTSGVDIGADTYIPLNHHIIIPRDDKRGFNAKTEVIIMVKGSYNIK